MHFANKAAKVSLIARREATAAVLRQVNTANLLADNRALMRLRELEVLEMIPSKVDMNIQLGFVWRLIRWLCSCIFYTNKGL